MSSSRIRMTHPYGQTPPNTFSDFDWIKRNEKALLEQYGECTIIVFKEQVIGKGTTYDEAVENAEHQLAPDVGLVTPVHYMLRQRHPFLRIRSAQTNSRRSDK